MEKEPIYQILGRKLTILNGTRTYKYEDQIEEHIETIINSHFPNGSGFDTGCTLDLDKSNGDRIEVKIPYHTMDEHGYYAGWIDPVLIVTPSLSYGFEIRINWKGYNGKYKILLLDYFYDLFNTILEKTIEYQTINISREKTCISCGSKKIDTSEMASGLVCKNCEKTITKDLD